MSRGFFRDRAGDEDGSFERPAEPFEPADQIHRRTDRSEIQPVSRADIAPQNFTKVQRHAERQLRQPLLAGSYQIRHSGFRGSNRA